MAESIVRYGTFDDTTFDQQAAQIDDLGGSIYIKAEVGENVFRFLPPPLGRNTPIRVTAMHYVDAVPGLQKTLVFACPRHELKQPCIVCAKADELVRSPNPVDRERGKRFAANLRVYACVVNRHSPEPVVKVYAFGKQVFDQLKAIRKSPRLGGDFTNPSETGFDIVIIRVGTGQNDTKYTVSADRSPSPLHPDPAFAQLLIDNQPDLDSLVEPIIPDALILAWGAAARGSVYQPAPGPAQAPGVLPSRFIPPSVAGTSQMPGAAGVPAHSPRAADSVQKVVEYDDDFNEIRK